MPVRLIESLATTQPLAEIFSDHSVLQAMLRFEVALARAEARLGVIPEAAAEHIAAAAKAEDFDIAELAEGSLRAGTPTIPLVRALTEKVRKRDSSAAGFVHWGATSQDVADTALVLLLKDAEAVVTAQLLLAEQALAKLARDHAGSVMLGRTLLQAAPPVTFGLKAAEWLGAIRRNGKVLGETFRAALMLQFGGASGTLAALGEKGIAVGEELSSELDLAFPDAPWHTQRDRLAHLICACGVLAGSLGKMARDISLLMQNEVAEVAEPGGSGRGGSSTMPHKRNPVGCAVTLAAAQRVPGLVSAFLSQMVQEHERGVGGWQAEWSTVAAVTQSTGLAAASMAEVARGLVVDPERMRANIEATNGIIFAEKVAMLLGRRLGKESAHKVLEEATRKCLDQKRRLSAVLAEMPEVAALLDPVALKHLDDPKDYLGAAEQFRVRLLAAGKYEATRGPGN
jgi:3-carboxy-cis,cis-muconate cycloisomerase